MREVSLPVPIREVPTNDLGMRTDVLDGCPKDEKGVEIADPFYVSSSCGRR